MRRTFLAALLAAGLSVTVTATASAATIRAVDDDGMATPQDCNAPNPASPTVQGAVNASSPGDTIVVCPGTYSEQVTIPSGKDNLTLFSRIPWQAVIQAPAVMAPPNAIVNVSGAHGARIFSFTIQGPGTIPGDLQYGVRVDSGGSASIVANHIAHIRDNPFTGAQHGVGVLVGRQAESTTGSALIAANLIEDYQKGGVVVSNSGSSGKVFLNRVRGVGPTTTIAANGIQVSSGAEADVEHNVVTGNQYSLPAYESIGILGFQPGKLTVEENVVHDNDGGIVGLSTDKNTAIKENLISANTYDGVELDFADGTLVRKNRTFKNGLDGVGLYSNSTNVLVQGNRATDNTEDGLLAWVDASGNTFRDNVALRNKKFDCEDQTIGTANTWLNNIGPVSSPPTICGPDDGHHGDDHWGDRSAPRVKTPGVRAFR